MTYHIEQYFQEKRMKLTLLALWLITTISSWSYGSKKLTRPEFRAPMSLAPAFCTELPAKYNNYNNKKKKKKIWEHLHY